MPMDTSQLWKRYRRHRNPPFSFVSYVEAFLLMTAKEPANA